MSDFPECDQFQDHRREICRGERPGMPIDGPNGVNAYRRLWGFAPINGVQATVSSPAAAASVDSPSLVIRGWNFAQAMARWTLAGMPRRTQEQINERLAICQACPFLENHHCQKCGCACVEENRLVNKLALATEKCPEGKWR